MPEGVGRRSRFFQVDGYSGEVMEPDQRGVRPWQGVWVCQVEGGCKWAG